MDLKISTKYQVSSTAYCQKPNVISTSSQSTNLNQFDWTKRLILKSLKVNPTTEGVQILWVGGGGGLLKPPLRNQ